MYISTDPLEIGVEDQLVGSIDPWIGSTAPPLDRWVGSRPSHADRVLDGMGIAYMKFGI